MLLCSANPRRRAGRVERIGSEYEIVTAAVFWPENALEDILGLMGRLEEKIAKISDTRSTQAVMRRKDA